MREENDELGLYTRLNLEEQKELIKSDNIINLLYILYLFYFNKLYNGLKTCQGIEIPANPLFLFTLLVKAVL